jgi:hypothetical protein
MGESASTGTSSGMAGAQPAAPVTPAPAPVVSPGDQKLSDILKHLGKGIGGINAKMEKPVDTIGFPEIEKRGPIQPFKYDPLTIRR